MTARETDPTPTRILTTVRAIERCLPIACADSARLRDALVEHLTDRHADVSALDAALPYVRIEVRDGLARQVRPPRETTRGIDECFEVLVPAALFAMSAASAALAAGAAALSVRAAREERLAEQELARIREELDRLEKR